MGDPVFSNDWRSIPENRVDVGEKGLRLILYIKGLNKGLRLGRGADVAMSTSRSPDRA